MSETKTDDELRAEIEANETRGEWGAWAVVVGLLLEIAIALTISFGVDNKWLDNWGAVVADSLIALGVYAEIHFGRRASHGNAELRRRSDERVAEANARAEEAKDRAAQAEVRLEELRERIGPRVIDRDAFLAVLKGKPKPSGWVDVMWSVDVPDGFSTALQLTELLKEAGWSTLGPSQPLNSVMRFEYAPHLMVRDADGVPRSTGSGLVVVWPDGEFQAADDSNPRKALFDAVIATLGAVTGRSDARTPSGCMFLLVFGRV